MIYIIIKTLITSLVVVLVSEIAKKSSLLAGILASVPLTSLLAFIWLYWDTKDIKQVSDLTNNTLLMILPSLTFFIFFPILLKLDINFFGSMLVAIFSTAICYWGYTIFLNKYFNISL